MNTSEKLPDTKQQSINQLQNTAEMKKKTNFVVENIFAYYEKKILPIMVKEFTNINKTNNHISP